MPNDLPDYTSNVSSPQALLGTLANNSHSFPTTTGMLAIAVMYHAVSSLSIVGDQSGTTYFSGSTTNTSSGVKSVPIYPAFDTSVTVTIAGGTAQVLALFDPTSIVVQGYGQGGTVVTSRGPVLQASSQLLNNAAVNVAAGPFGGPIRYLRRMWGWMWPSVAGLNILDIQSNQGGTTYTSVACNQAGVVVPILLEWDDFPLAPDTNGQYQFRLHNSGASAGAITAYVTALGFVGSDNVG